MAGRMKTEGVTLIELLIVMAILAIIGAIAIPAYTIYLDESRINVTIQNTEPLRLALEGYFLEENTYIAGVWVPTGLQTLETGDLGWRPDGDNNQFSYSVVAGATGNIATSYTMTVQRTDGAATVVCNRNQTAGSYSCAAL